MTPNIAKLQAEQKELEDLILSLKKALRDSHGILNTSTGIKIGFVLRTQAGLAALLRCDKSIEIMTDALHNILTIKTRRLEVIKAKLAAIEELLEDSI